MILVTTGSKPRAAHSRRTVRCFQPAGERTLTTNTRSGTGKVTFSSEHSLKIKKGKQDLESLLEKLDTDL